MESLSSARYHLFRDGAFSNPPLDHLLGPTCSGRLIQESVLPERRHEKSVLLRASTVQTKRFQGYSFGMRGKVSNKDKSLLINTNIWYITDIDDNLESELPERSHEEVCSYVLLLHRPNDFKDIRLGDREVLSLWICEKEKLERGSKRADWIITDTAVDFLHPFSRGTVQMVLVGRPS
ncbi:hypothetical protein CEXT_130171 [Caerostris extrusa]|uniref:Uncharacterized protein n=1 Tax=Caerostris extrusa TaxID=172846 RepID=A0AAV4W0J1_CAEEX|nr:hypothetical protein CEXT_130171 [Caerostris extrusa]